MKKIVETVEKAIGASATEVAVSKDLTQKTKAVINNDKAQEEAALAATKAATVTMKVNAVMKRLPQDKVTPKHIDEAFGFNDGGKTIRRHLRKHFGDNHEHKADWNWAKNDPVLAKIVTYFAERYEPAQEKKEDKKAAK
jgi:predicted transcriptional regulator